MITVIAGTNRPNSLTLTYAQHIVEDLRGRTDETIALLDLRELDHSFFTPAMYDPAKTPAGLRRVQEDLVLQAKKLVIVSPEYNGSFPGVLKTFIDAISVHRYAENFKHKPVCLIGVSTGRAGNLRGLDHLSGILLHMGAHLLQDKLPISKAKNWLDDAGKLADENTISAIAKQTAYLTSI
ncbi:MAG: NAD(P)H-dependent oxidoreductase [Bacteroidota bacterium]